MANSETILSANTHPGDSANTVVTGEKFRGDGYYGRTDGFHTIQYSIDGFIGTVVIQATLAMNPIEADWFAAYTQEYLVNAGQGTTKSKITNFTGNYVWIRAVITYSDGSVNSIRLNH
tara:strand:+ start:1024 stop:1377 length:354 start_codon:yes stop_codon:yes gene_type:complete